MYSLVYTDQTESTVTHVIAYIIGESKAYTVILYAHVDLVFGEFNNNFSFLGMWVFPYVIQSLLSNAK